ncbi:MazG nucleotide pyrophosphohydrolase domain-containing protein [Amycolatopsis tolypomycina]|uniref:MazG nucleotide pyrophosphohydrolase domain-containing protein n=1 Tax=Amycolatopsis tolypomycina TaxID=208445 RepID=UPI00339E9548
MSSTEDQVDASPAPYLAANLNEPTKSSLQEIVHDSVIAVGGYWRPASATIRLLEELAELAEAIHDESKDLASITEELADVFFISTCLANQFGVALPDRHVVSGEDAASLESKMLLLVQICGRLARVINYYDGPKNLKKSESLTPIGDIVAQIHAVLRSVARQLRVDLDLAVRSKAAKSRVRDSGRFPMSFDPSTADSLTEFRSVTEASDCSFARQAKIWGAPTWNVTKSLHHNVDQVIPFLISFTKATRHESLDGFVIAPSLPYQNTSISKLSRSFEGLLKAINRGDPARSPCLDGNIAKAGWQFEFNGRRLFVSVFSPLYPGGHPRAAHRDFVLFQPEESFDEHRVGSAYSESEVIRTAVRRKFQERGLWYPEEVIDSRIEGHIYLLPLRKGDPPVEWWLRGTDQLVLF